MNNRIAETRKEQGISQENLAVSVGISRPHLSEIENGKAEAGGTIVLRIAAALNKSVEDIFFMKDVV